MTPMQNYLLVSLAATVVASGGTLTAAAQPAIEDADAGGVQVDALQCWRQIGTNTVRVGEPFTMTLTCAVVETDTARAVPNEVVLDPEIIDLAPFEVLDGERYADLHAGPRRFLQLGYTLRLVGEEYFGEDVEIPALDVTYRIERALDPGAALAGRELTYILPAQSVRVLSLVPEDAADIREPSVGTFGDAETRLFRATLMVMAAAALGIVALAFLVAAALRVRQERRGSVPRGETPVPAAAVAHRALAEMTALQRASQEKGWDGTLAGRALAAFRLTGAVALSYPIAQQVVDTDTGDREGQLSLRRGFWRPKTTVISSALTLDAVTSAIDRMGTARPDTAAELDDLRGALSLFTAARYGNAADLPTDVLTRELDKGMTLARRLRIRTLAPLRTAERALEAVRQWWMSVWRH